MNIIFDACSHCSIKINTSFYLGWCRRWVIKDGDNSVPLSDTFPLLKPFSRDVELALQEKKKCKESNKKFISVIASAVLVYNRYPSASDYENVGWAVLSKYVFSSIPTRNSSGTIMVTTFIMYI